MELRLSVGMEKTCSKGFVFIHECIQTFITTAITKDFCVVYIRFNVKCKSHLKQIFQCAISASQDQNSAHTLIFFFLPVKRFQAALVKYMTVEVCLLLPKFKLTLVRVEALPEAADKHGSKRTRVHTCDLAYVLHTSGTTGLPKIVKVPHKCILPNILHLRSVTLQTVVLWVS